jgi:hypothetical protein
MRWSTVAGSSPSNQLPETEPTKNAASVSLGARMLKKAALLRVAMLMLAICPARAFTM